jgi:hypothetical protein
MRTLADLPPRLQPRAIREANFRNLLDPTALPSVTSHPGAARLRRTLELNAPANARPHPTRSLAEHDLLDLIHDLGLPSPLINHVVAGRERDFHWPAHALVVELDGPQHDRGDAPAIDRARDRHLLATTGIRTVRFVPDDPISDVARTLTALLVR